MRLRSLSVAVLTAVLLVPVSASTAAAAESGSSPRATAMGKTFKNSEAKRVRRARAAVAPVAPAPAPVSPPATVSPPSTATSYADRVLALTNAQRSSRGLRALAFSSCADGYANSWARSLASVGSLSHQPLAPILTACGARSVGENVAFGNVSPETLVQMWMDSPGHRANILNPGFTHLGVGDVTTSTGRVYGVQVFLTL